MPEGVGRRGKGRKGWGNRVEVFIVPREGERKRDSEGRGGGTQRRERKKDQEG